MRGNTKIVQWLGIVIALVALFATVLGLFLQFRPKSRELTAQVLASDELTAVANIRDLTAQYTYMGKEVDHLWKVTVSFINSGDQTIVGEGQQKTLIRDGVLLAFPEGTEILNIEEEAKDFPVTVEKEDTNHFKLKFSQWREGERVTLAFYVSASGPIADPLLPMVETRDIVDGDVLIGDLRATAVPPQRSLVDRLPDPIRIPAMVLGYPSLFFGPLFLLLVGTWGVIDGLRLDLWKRRNMSEFAKYIEGLQRILPSEKELFISKPYKLPSSLWADFKGEKLSVTSSPFDSLLAAATIGPLAFLMALSSALVLASAIQR